MDINLEKLKDPSSMSNSAKLGVIVALFFGALGAGYFFDTSAQIAALDEQAAREVSLRETYLDRKKQAVNLDAHKRQLQEIEVAFGTLLRQLPNKSEMDALLNDVNQAGVGRGLSFDLFRPAPELVTEFYAEQPVNINVAGSYHQFGAFAEDISRLPRIVNLDDISLKASNDLGAIYKGAEPKLVLEAVVRTYRYLDDKEMADAKKAKK